VRSYEEALNLIVELSSDMDNVEKERKKRLRSDLHKADRARNRRGSSFSSDCSRNSGWTCCRTWCSFHLVIRSTPRCSNTSTKTIGVPYNRRAFIMTKYPDEADAKLDAQLQTVINTVKDAVKAKAYHPYLAGEKAWHQNLWENVEFHMLVCARGIAIVEDRFNPKLNPNVAMEWGWMRAMKKPVLYLVEKRVPAAQIPADMMGLIRSWFDWDNPEADIPRLIAEDLGLAPGPRVDL